MYNLISTEINWIKFEIKITTPSSSQSKLPLVFFTVFLLLFHTRWSWDAKITELHSLVYILHYLFSELCKHAVYVQATALHSVRSNNTSKRPVRSVIFIKNNNWWIMFFLVILISFCYKLGFPLKISLLICSSSLCSALATKRINHGLNFEQSLCI